MDIDALVRTAVRGLEPYVPGTPMEAVRDRFGLTDVVKLASNENPLGPSPRALQALAAAARELHRYPDASAWALRVAIGKHHGLPPDAVVASNGGDNCLTLVAQTFLEAGDEAVVPHPSFSAYAAVTRVAGARPVAVPLRDYACDLEAMARAVTSRTRVVFLGNPHNPTGAAVGEQELRVFLDRLPEHVLVVLDEAYAEYAEAPDFPRSAALVREGRPIAVLRTFSKVYGLAGLRLGYLLTPPPLAQVLQRVREPFSVSRLALAAGVAALDDREHLERSLRLNREGKELLLAGLRARGFRPLPSQANFLFFDAGRDDLYERLLREGVIVRPGAAWGLPTWIRVTVGTPAENERFLSALDRALSG
ncbi:MAG: histidinol-phosphate transaminase [Clostridia bacterium]|nr:histidinol-phosphate transaminase [Clostridia bacterium]